MTDGKRSLIKLVFKQLYLEKGILTYEMAPAFKLIQELAKIVESSKEQLDTEHAKKIFEPTNNIDMKTQRQYLRLHCPSLLARVDSDHYLLFSLYNYFMISRRATELPVSSIRKLLPIAYKTKEAGVKTYHLNIGEPDIQTPEVIINSLKSWNQNPIKYAPSGGTKEFINSVLWYYHKLGFSFLKAEHIIGTVGSSEAIFMALFSTCNPGDEVLVFEPFYSSYATSAKLVDIAFSPVETTVDTSFHLPNQDGIEKKITPKTKAIIYSNPCNPTGAVYTKKEIEMLVKIAKKHSLFLISDEVYREYIFVDWPHISLFSYIEEIPDLAIVVDSLSKRYNLCGSRLGMFITLNKDLLTSAMRIAMSRLSGGLVDQYMGTFLTKVPDSYIKDVQKEYKERRDLVYKGLKNISGVTVSKPEGAFYIMAQLPVDNAEKFCIWLLEKYRNNNETIMMAPGYGFYKGKAKGLKEVRIAYVLKKEDLQHSLYLLQDALEEYNKIKS